MFKAIKCPCRTSYKYTATRPNHYKEVQTTETEGKV